MATRKFNSSDFTRTSGDGTSFFSMDDTRITFYFPLQTKDDTTFTTDIYQCQFPSTDSNVIVYNIYYGFAKWTGTARQRVDCANSYVYLPGVVPFRYCYVSAGSSSAADDSVFVSADDSVEYIQVRGLETMVNYRGQVQNTVSTTRSSPCITVGSKFPVKWDGYWESSCEAIWFYISFDREYSVTEEEPSYTLTYSPNGKVKSGLPVSYTYKAGDTFVVPQSFSWTFNDGEELNYFTKNSGGTGTIYYPGSSYTMPSNSLVLYAQVKNAVYQIYYFPNGKFKDDPSYKTVNYTYNSDVYPNLPREWTVKDHITVTSWNTKADGSGDSYPVGTKFSMPAKNFSLYAQSEDINYYVYLRTNGKTSSGSDLYTFGPYQASYNIPVGGPDSWKYPDGYIFHSFNTKSDGSGVTYPGGSSYTIPDETSELFCQTAATEQKVIMESNGNTTVEMSLVNRKKTGETLIMNIPSTWTIKSDKIPDHWSDDKNDGIFSVKVDIGASYTVGATDKTFYLICKDKDKYNVTYKSGDGSGSDKSFQYITGETATAIEYPSDWVEPSDKSFANWKVDGKTIYYFPGNTFTVTDNITLIAQYALEYYYLSFNKNGGSGTDMPKIRGRNGSASTIPTCTYTPPDRKVFKEWNSNSDGSGTKYDVGSSYTFYGDKTLYAIWSDIPAWYVKYCYDETETTFQRKGPYINGQEYELIECPLVWQPPEGCVFAGWKDSSGTIHSPGDTQTMGTSEVKYYANWELIIINRRITVSYNENAGIVVPGSGIYKDGDSIMFVATPISTYDVSGWSLQGPGVFTYEGNTATLTVSGDATVNCNFSLKTTTSAVSLGPCIVTKTDWNKYRATTSFNGVVDHWELLEGYGNLSVSGNTCTINAASPSYILRCVGKFNTNTNSAISEVKQASPYTIVVKNGSSCCVFKRGISSLNWYSNLSFSKKIDGVGGGSFTVHSKTPTNTDRWDPMTQAVVPHAEVYILENGMPIYAGYITKKNKTDNNFYGDHSGGKIREYDVQFSDYLRKLNNVTQTLNNGMYTGSPGQIAYKLLGDECGLVEAGRSEATFQITKSDKLNQLDKLGDLCGWRYRSRPYIVNTLTNVTSISSSSISFGNSIVNVNYGDLVSVVSGDNLYVYKCDTTSSGSVSSISVTLIMNYGDIKITSGNMRVYIWRGAIIDFAPSFYQEDSVVVEDNTIPSGTSTKKAWGTNRISINNKCEESTECEYGGVIVTSSSSSGLTNTCEILAFKSHKKDYTQNETTYITHSGDTTISKYEFIGDLNLDVAKMRMYLSSVNTFTVDAVENYDSYIWYTMGDQKYCCMILGQDCELVDIDYTAGTATPGDNMCILTVEISTNNVHYNNLKTGKPTMRSIRCMYYAINSCSDLGITSPGNYELTIGGQNIMMYVDTNMNMLTPCPYTHVPSAFGDMDSMYCHGVGCIVMKGGAFTSTDDDSPLKKYGMKYLSATMQNNYPYIDCELLASNYIMFGSNFDNQGSCDIALPFAKKNDGQFSGCLVDVGDHIAIYESGNNKSDNVKHYELLEYSVNTDTFSGGIKYGTSTTDLGKYMYNLRKNTTTNIVR